MLAVQERLLPVVAQHMQDLARQGTLWETPEHILGSLMHTHLNRLGLHGDQEHRVYAFWRQTLESLRKRPGPDGLARSSGA